jgi:lysylphosphatidylglycerol synthetase-like protein (DUF2156 family)
MEGSSRQLSDQEVEERIPELLVNFRQVAHSHGMHDQVLDVSETFIKQAYRRGLEDCRSA